jgi:thermitase
VVVAPAGNTAVNLTYANDPNILTVSGLEFGGALLWSQSCWGTPVDMSSPCTFWTMYPNGGSILTVGSSYAASAVSGVAALVLAVKPGLTGPQLLNILVQTTDDVGSAGWDPVFGSGRLNAERALIMAGGGGTGDTQIPFVQITAPQDQAHVHSKTTIKASASDNLGVIRVEFYVDEQLRGSDSTEPYQWVWRSANATQGLHQLQCKAFDAAGNAGLSAVITVIK